MRASKLHRDGNRVRHEHEVRQATPRIESVVSKRNQSHRREGSDSTHDQLFLLDSLNSNFSEDYAGKESWKMKNPSQYRLQLNYTSTAFGHSNRSRSGRKKEGKF